jgi:ribosomal protein S18 acetylase RimI-like enzyme
VQFHAICCWEPTDVNDSMMRAAERLYEQTLDPVERIPWAWIERSVAGGNKSGGWRKHLILAAPEGRHSDPTALAGYAYGAFIPGYGGYLCYVGVAEWARRLGVGKKLFEAFFQAMQADANAAEEPLPFVVWESHRPEADEQLWNARVRLFDRVGGYWIEGVNFLAPNFAENEGEPVELQLFLKPMDRPVSAFHEARLLGVVHGLHERVYRIDEGDPLYEGTLEPGCRPKLVPAGKAVQAIVSA